MISSPFFVIFMQLFSRLCPLSYRLQATSDKLLRCVNSKALINSTFKLSNFRTIGASHQAPQSIRASPRKARVPCSF